MDFLAPTTLAVSSDVGIRRDPLHRSELGMVEFCVFPEPDALVEGFTPNHQIALTLTGAFRWRALGDDKIVDPTRLLLIVGGHEYRETLTDAGGGHSVVIATPSARYPGSHEAEPDLAADARRRSHARL